MSAISPWLAIGIGLFVLACVALVFTMMLRRAACPGGPLAAAIVGGIVAGVLIGPSVAGRLVPAIHERVFVGATEQTKALREATAEHDRALRALAATGVTGVAIDEQRAAYESQRKPLVDTREKALAEHRTRWSLIASVVLMAHLYLATVLAFPSRTPTWRRIAREIGEQPIQIMLAGTVMLFLAVTPPAVFVAVMLQSKWTSAVATGLIFGAPAVAVILSPRSLIIATSASVLAFALAAGIGWTIQLTIAAVGVFLALLSVIGTSSSTLKRIRHGVQMSAHLFTLPLLAALCVVNVDMHAAGNNKVFWLAVIIGVLWSSDGRWFAAFTAMRTVMTDRQSPPTWTSAAQFVDAGAGAAQIVFILLLLPAGLIAPEFAAGAAIGAAVAEVTRDLRGGVARFMDQGPAE